MRWMIFALLLVLCQLACEASSPSFTTLPPGQTTISGTIHTQALFYEFTGLPPGDCFSLPGNPDENVLLGLYNESNQLVSSTWATLYGNVDSKGNIKIGIAWWYDNTFNGNYSSDFNETFSLNVTLITPPADPNKDFAHSTVLPAGQESYISQLYTIPTACTGVAGDVEFLTFSFNPGQCWYTEFSSATVSQLLGVFAPNGTLLTYNYNPLSGTIDSTGKLHIAVTGYDDYMFVGNHKESGTYNLTVVIQTYPPDSHGTFATALLLPAGNLSISGNINYTSGLCAKGSVDFFNFQVQPGLCVQTKVVAPQLNYLLGLFYKNGTVLETSWSELTTVVDSSGIVYMAMTGYDDSLFVGNHQQSGAYTVNLQTYSLNHSVNSNFSHRVTFNGVTHPYYAGQLLVNNAPCSGEQGDVNFVSFTNLPSGYCFYTTISDSFYEMLGWFDDSGNLLSYEEGEPHLSGKVPADGIINIGITGYGDYSFVGAHSQSGTFNLSIFTVAPVTVDPHQTFNTSLLLPANVSSYSGALGPVSAPPCNNASDVNFIQFQASPGGCFSVNISASFSYLFGLFNSTTGALIQYSYGGAIAGIVPSNGLVTIAVTGYPDTYFVGAHSQSGNYTLFMNVFIIQPDNSENFSQAQNVNGSLVQGTLYPSNPACGGGDVDWWLLRETPGTCFHTVTNATFEYYLGAANSTDYLMDASYTYVSGYIPTNGIIALAVTGWPDTNFDRQHDQSGNYTVQLVTETLAPDTDNTFATRQIINVSSLPYSGILSGYQYCTGWVGQVDFVTVTGLNPGDCFQTSYQGTLNEIWGLFADNGTLIQTDGYTLTGIVPSSGRLNFAISGWDDNTFVGDHSQTGNYTFNLTLAASPHPQEEGNGNFQNRTILPAGVTWYSGKILPPPAATPCQTVAYTYDVDFITFTVNGSCDYTSSIQSDFDSYLGLFNDTGGLVTGTSGSITGTLNSSGELNFAVTGWPDQTFVGLGTSWGTYNLTLVLNCGHPPPGFSRVLPSGSTEVKGTIIPGKVDFWSFESLPAGACFETQIVVNFEELLGWFNDTGTLIQSTGNVLLGNVPPSGQVNIGITGWYDSTFNGSHTRSGSYDLTLSITQNPPPPPSDGDSTFATALVTDQLEVSGRIDAIINHTPCPNDAITVNDVDYFKFVNLTASYCAATTMTANFAYIVALLNSTGSVVDWEYGPLYAIIPSSGVLYMGVTGYPDYTLVGDHQQNGNFTLLLSITHNPPKPVDSNGVFSSATIIPYYDYSVSGSIWSQTDQTPCPGDFNATNDVDFYRFGPFTAGSCFQTQMSNVNFDYILGWFNSSGQLIQYSVYQLTDIVPAGGFIYIAVSGWPDTTFSGLHSQNGNYTLTLTLSSNPPPPQPNENNDFSHSTILKPGVLQVQESIWGPVDNTPCPLDSSDVGQVDFWTFTGLTPGSCFETVMHSNFYYLLGLFNDSGKLTQFEEYVLLGLIPASEKVNIAVTGWDDQNFDGHHSQNGNYTLSLSITRNNPPGEQNNNQFSDRVILPAGVDSYSNYIWFIRDQTPCPNDTPPSDVDYFTFTGLEAGSCFWTSTEVDATFFNILGWFNEIGTEIEWSWDNMWGVVPENGKVTLAISGFPDYLFNGDHSNGGYYRVTIQTDPYCGGGAEGSSGDSALLEQWCSNNCKSKQCGSDGCGGYCGTGCGSGYCLLNGTCSSSCDSICTEGQECGWDGCGGECGICPGDQDVCSNGNCVCVGQCTERMCGDDGCGGSCGDCTESQNQCFDGQCLCVPACNTIECGSDGCGGICGVCGPYYICGSKGSCIRDPMTQPSCNDYFGFPPDEANLVLLETVNNMLMNEINTTIDSLIYMRDALLNYNPDSQSLPLAAIIDQIHLFCSGPYNNDMCLSLAEVGFIDGAFLSAITAVRSSSS